MSSMGTNNSKATNTTQQQQQQHPPPPPPPSSFILNPMTSTPPPPPPPTTPPANNKDQLRRSEEGVENYKVGGYHPVEIGEVYNKRYRVLKKLGWGHFSTVWLCEDTSPNPTHPHIAMKVQKSGSAYAEAAVDEIHLLSTATAADTHSSKYVVKLLDNFQVSGPNGIHHCMIFELLGDNLLALIRYFSKQNCPNRYGKGIPIPLVRRIAREVLMALDYLHRKCHIIHTDLKPENILLQKSLSQTNFVNGELVEDAKFDASLSERSTFVKVVDLGNACWTHKHFTDYITTRQYRSPEAIVELHYSSAVDIWSLACILFELITGDYLFEPRADKNGAYTRDEDHLALMIELLGDAPDAIKKKGRCSSTFFTRSGALRNISDLVHWPLENLLREKVNIPKQLASEIASFLSPMLEMDPSKRFTASQCLRHPFVAFESDVQTYSTTNLNNISYHQNQGTMWSQGSAVGNSTFVKQNQSQLSSVYNPVQSVFFDYGANNQQHSHGVASTVFHPHPTVASQPGTAYQYGVQQPPPAYGYAPPPAYNSNSGHHKFGSSFVPPQNHPYQ